MSAIGENTLGLLTEQSFERRGDYPSLLFEGRWYGSRELFERSCRIAAGLTALGVCAGDRVVVTMANCPEVQVVYQAVWRAGGVVTPATFLLSPEELTHVTADSEACAIVTTSEFADKVCAAARGLHHVRYVISTGGERPGVLRLTEVEESESQSIVPRADHDLAALLYTGGTTGQSKGVMLSHSSLCYSGRSAYQSAHVPGVIRSLMTLPLSHAFGLLVTITGLHYDEQATSVLLRWFNATTFLEMVEEHRLQAVAVVPSMLQLLLGEPLEDYDLSSLLYVNSGGAPLPPEVEQEFVRRVPSVTVRQGYGLTETAALVSSNPVGHERRGSVGRPVPETEVRILDDEGRALPPGQPGEVCCRSPGVMQGYWRSGGRDPELTAEALRDGWLHTGDIGYLDDDGYLYIVDRKKDLIIRGGFNVYPRDVEDELVEHPAVRMAAVVGRPDLVHGEEIVAFVAPAAGAELTAEELIAWAREHIGAYKYPREVHFVDSLPLTTVGKIDRKVLRAQLVEAAGDGRAQPRRGVRSRSSLS
jgi:long-chain acyl-CoA synthetase